MILQKTHYERLHGFLSPLRIRAQPSSFGHATIVNSRLIKVRTLPQVNRRGDIAVLTGGRVTQINEQNMPNAMMVIFPYRHQGMWVFDDAAAGLSKEPFVEGIPEIIDRVVADIPNAEQGFRLIFSGSPFPSYRLALSWLRKEYDGNWYRVDGTGEEGWLCPALFKYFDSAPKKIYCAAQRK